MHMHPNAVPLCTRSQVLRAPPHLLHVRCAAAALPLHLLAG